MPSGPGGRVATTTPRPGHGCPSSATFETSVAGPSSDSWKTPAATWSTSSRSSTTTATPVPATSDSKKQKTKQKKKLDPAPSQISLLLPSKTPHSPSQTAPWPIVASETLENCPPTVHNMAPLKPHDRTFLCQNPAPVSTKKKKKTPNEAR